jgi:hypothetical protein
MCGFVLLNFPGQTGQTHDHLLADVEDITCYSHVVTFDSLSYAYRNMRNVFGSLFFKNVLNVGSLKTPPASV